MASVWYAQKCVWFASVIRFVKNATLEKKGNARFLFGPIV